MESRGDDADARLSAETMAEAVRAAAAARSPEGSLRAVIDLAVRAAGCDGASITARGPGKAVETIAYSDDRILKADELQYELGEGPCLDAVRSEGVFLVRDLGRDDRWPRWAPLAAGLGVRSLLAVHLFTDTGLGALSLYSCTPRDFDGATLQDAKVVAAYASVVLAHAGVERNMWRAIDARNTIGQAQGILMARYGLTADRAFAVLRRYSQDHNVRVAVLAGELIATGRLAGLNDGGLIAPE